MIRWTSIFSCVLVFLTAHSNCINIPIRGDSGQFPKGEIPNAYTQWNVQVPQGQVKITFDTYNLTEGSVFTAQTRGFVQFFFNGILNYISKDTRAPIPFLRSIGDPTLNLSLLSPNPGENAFKATYQEVNVTSNVNRITIPQSDKYSLTRSIDPPDQEDFTDLTFLRLPYPVSTNQPIVLSVSCAFQQPNYLQIYTYDEQNPDFAQTFNWFAANAHEQQFVLQKQNILFVAQYDKSSYNGGINQTYTILFDRRLYISTTPGSYTTAKASSSFGGSFSLAAILVCCVFAQLREKFELY